jgi:hypothetical protein
MDSYELCRFHRRRRPSKQSPSAKVEAAHAQKQPNQEITGPSLVHQICDEMPINNTLHILAPSLLDVTTPAPRAPEAGGAF